MNKNDPAFPSGTSWVDAEGFHSQIANVPGLTKLEWFAGAALKALIARDYVNYDDLASDAFLLARSMVAEGAKEGK